ncbi:MAG: IPT/TIG domain-containing protein [Acidobacteria bacterium]|nr:IPT/TIG domain-containing protein [Acidobacteriota bacterium]
MQQLTQAPLEAIKGANDSLLTLPLPDGSFANFRLEESPVLPTSLASKYTGIKSFRGEAADHSGAFMRCDWSPRGLHATILYQNQVVSIHPLAYDNQDYYVSYFGSQINEQVNNLRCLVDERKHVRSSRQVESTSSENVPIGPIRRTYRLALASTVEYTNNPMLGGGSVATTVATFNTWVNALNVIYEKELSVRFVLAENTDRAIFTAEPDGLTDGDNFKMVDEIRSIFETKVGIEKYDLGQVLSPGSGGLAYIGVVCSSDNYKGGGVTLVSGSRPVGTGYGLATLAHEIGHQFNARHTFSDTASPACNSSQFPVNTAYESFAGMTIMSYAEACTPIVWFVSPHFHSGSYGQISAFLNNVNGAGSCAITSNTGNQTPTLNVGANYTIPKGTPFTLTATGSDPDAGDIPNLTYSWEQLDSGTKPSTTDGSVGPLFRPFQPSASPSRTFPSLTYILNQANVPPDEVFGLKTAEALPNVAREMNFRCLIRDGHGGVNTGAVLLTVANAGPFLVTSPNTSVSWTGGTTQTVTWSANGTNIAPINCQNVKISLSLDDGLTFPLVLAASVPNTGSANVNVPSGMVSSQARIKVEAANNIFFDISDTRFSLTPGSSCPAISGIQPVIGAVGSTVTITGANFTGVSTVKFANNQNANFTIVSDNQITVTVPAGAVNGLISLSKTNCVEAKSGIFTVIPNGAYVSQVDDNSIESSSRFSGVPQVHFVNRLTPSSYPATLTAITLFIPNSVEIGTDYRLVMGFNSSGSSNIDGLALQEIPIKTTAKNQFITFPVPNRTIPSGDFVVGFAHVPQDGVFPVGIDTTAPIQNRSYNSFLGGAQFNLVTTRNYAIRAQIAPGSVCTPNTCSTNTAPSITANPMSPILQGSTGKTVTLASVNDAETAMGNLTVTVGELPSGITLADLTNSNGTITAKLTVECGVSLGATSIPLTVTDTGGLSATTSLPVTIASNTAPSLGAYSFATLNLGNSTDFSPNAAPNDNGIVKSIVASAPGFSGSFVVNPTSGVISISNAGPVGTYTVTVTATDNCDATKTTQFTLAVIQLGAALEADVSPRSSGNGSVSIADWTQMGRFVAGLDSIATGEELQRADCAPRATAGDGKITITDWVQAGRYAAGLDPIATAGGPSSFSSSLQARANPGSRVEGSAAIRAVSHPMIRGSVNSLPIRFNALGNENALGFSITFDPRLLSFYRAAQFPGSTLTLNTTQLANGNIGFLLAMPAGQTFPAGEITLLTLEFFPLGGESEITTRFTFNDQVVACAASDVFANELPHFALTETEFSISGRAAAHVSAASYTGTQAASESIISAFGTKLANTTLAANSLPLPTSLGGTTVTIKDQFGNEKAAPLFFVSPNQVNYLLPNGLTEGLASITITNEDGLISRGVIDIEQVAPGIFSAEASGKGLAAADVQRIHNGGTESYERVAAFDPISNQFVANPIALRSDEQAFLILYGTGLKFRSDLSAVKAKIGGIEAEVLYAGPQGRYVGLDQINLRLPPGLAGRGDCTVELEIDGLFTNPVRISIQ